MKKRSLILMGILAAMMFVDGGYAPFSLPVVFAHCDTLDGPVVQTARAALEKGDLTPVLKWVRKEDERMIKDQFERTLAVRKQSREARELADMYFFESLVRIHRAGEGAPYTGLKPGESVEPSVAAADKALETGSVDRLVKLVTSAAEKGIRERFAHAAETKKHADQGVDHGREFVAAYVDFTHYVERLHMDAEKPAGHAHGPSEGSSTPAHQH